MSGQRDGQRSRSAGDTCPTHPLDHSIQSSIPLAVHLARSPPTTRVLSPAGCVTEWKVFEALAHDEPNLLSRVGQLLIELHAWPPARKRTRRIPYDFRLQQLQTFAGHVLDRHGFAVAERHLNPWNLFWNDSFADMLPHELRASGVSTAWACWELVLLHKRRA